MQRKGSFPWLGNVAVLVIAIAFFVISCLGYMMGDDLWMNSDVSTLFDLVKHTAGFYLYRGGRMFSVACQYMFSGVLGDNRIWYAIVNTLFFVVFLVACGKLIQEEKQGFASNLLLFALLFWFLCPHPNQTLFWIAGSTTYLWANTLSFVFLLLYLKYKDDCFGVKEKVGLFVISFLAASEFITCASICGAFVVYYAFNFKKLRGNAIPFVAGFVLGSIVLLFAPGNFRRAAWDSEGASIFDIGYLLHHPLLEMAKYRAFWVFLVVLVWCWIKNREIVKSWMKNNAVLLLSLGWSVIAFSVVFRPVRRALFFTETLSIILALKLLYDHRDVFKIRFLEKLRCRNTSMVKNVVIALLFAVFLVDAAYAAMETNHQKKNNDVSLEKIVDSGGFVVLDKMLSSHRMAYSPLFDQQSCKHLVKILDMDTICVYPYYCMDKYYHQGFPMKDVFIADDYYADNADMPDYVVVLVVRIANDKILGKGGRVVFTFDCDSFGTMVFEREAPAFCVEGYCYYPFNFYRDDVKTLKRIQYEFK